MFEINVRKFNKIPAAFRIVEHYKENSIKYPQPSE